MGLHIRIDATTLEKLRDGGVYEPLRLALIGSESESAVRMGGMLS